MSSHVSTNVPTSAVASSSDCSTSFKMKRQKEINELMFKRHHCIESYIKHMKIKDKRNIFTLLESTETINPNTFIPSYGMTFGEFCFYYIICDETQKIRRLKRKKQIESQHKDQQQQQRQQQSSDMNTNQSFVQEQEEQDEQEERDEDDREGEEHDEEYDNTNSGDEDIDCDDILHNTTIHSLQ